MPATAAHGLIWAISALSVLGILARPRGWPEAVWAVGGALLLVVASLLPLESAWAAVRRGTDVYLFLTGMMLLAELARRQGLFAWLAAWAARSAHGSPRRLFVLVYVVGIAVTMLLSNDATAVVLTPAVYAVARAARARPLPYLYICAFIANAASFVLPMGNPANLVVFAQRLPPLHAWLAAFFLASVVAIVATFVVLWLTQRRALQGAIERHVPVPPLSSGGRVAAVTIALAALLLLIASALGMALGAPTCIAGVVGCAVALARSRDSPGPLLRGVSWSVLPLVAGLFVLVAGVNQTGLLNQLSQLLRTLASHSPGVALWEGGLGTALACNVTNNLPIALLAGQTLRTMSSLPASLQQLLANSILIGVDLGPNLSITGSLATILWLIALRREGERVGVWQFLWLGARIMLPALLLALGVEWLQAPAR